MTRGELIELVKEICDLSGKSEKVGYELWFLKKVNKKWKKQCYINVSSIN